MREKAISVTAQGEPDGWLPTPGFRAQQAPDGNTRLVASVGPDALSAVHIGLLKVLGSPLDVRYVQLTDRATGQLAKPVSWVGMGLPAERVAAVFDANPQLIWGDARHQLWVRGPHGDSVVLDELGVLYTYPDDPAFRDALGEAGLPLSEAVGLDGRDYVKVQFLSEADAQEQAIISALGLRQIG